MRLQTVVAVAIVAAAATYLVVGRSTPVALPEAGSSPIEIVSPVDAPTEGTIVVHVSGCVAAPGIVELTSDARVAAAIAEAGGALRCADLARVNLAAELGDGQQLVVPSLGSGSEPSVSPPTDAADERVNLNTATVGELDALPGIGPVLAERIVRFRTERGPFTAVEDLLDVAGIGEAKLLELRDLVVL